MFKEFKEFAFRGNVIDLAIATIMGATFNTIVSSLVDNVFMPIIGIMMGGISFEHLILKIGAAEIKYGLTLGAGLKFILVAMFLFMVIRMINKFNAKKVEAPAPPPAPTKSEELLEEILKALKK
jgi:large conductance mechanosensitive channel